MADQLVATFMIVMGLAIAGVWTADIVRGTEIDRSRGLLRARQRRVASRLAGIGSPSTARPASCSSGRSGCWPPARGPSRWRRQHWERPGTSVNSLGWALAERSRRAYAAPIGVGLLGSLVCLGALVASS
jgi:hypothetical protein